MEQALGISPLRAAPLSLDLNGHARELRAHHYLPDIPFQNLLHRLPDIMRGSVALRKVEHMKLALANQDEIETSSSQAVYPRCQITLNQVAYTYHPHGEEHGFQLGPVSLSLEPGLTYLIGGKGSGKSTLAKLITGLYVPEAGSITLNGVPIDDLNREWYRRPGSKQAGASRPIASQYKERNPTFNDKTAESRLISSPPD